MRAREEVPAGLSGAGLARSCSRLEESALRGRWSIHKLDILHALANLHDEELDGFEKHLRWTSALDHREPRVGTDSPAAHWCLWNQCMVRNLWWREEEADYWVVELSSNVGSQRSACFR